MGFFFARPNPHLANRIEYDRGNGGSGILEEHDTVRTGVHQQFEEMYHDIAECFVEESASSTIAPRDSRQYSTDHGARVTQSGASVPSSAHSARSTTTARQLTNSFTRFKESVDSQGNTTTQPHAELHSGSEDFATTGPVGERWAQESATYSTRKMQTDQETDLSQSGMRVLDNLFSKGSATNIRPSLEVQLRGCSLNPDTRQSAHDNPAENDAPINIATDHSFETFAAIGQMQMEQSLATTTDQTDEYPNAPNVTPRPGGIMTRIALGLFVAIPSILGWVWCLWIAVAPPFIAEAGTSITDVIAKEADNLVTINLNRREAAPFEKIAMCVVSRITYDIASIEAPFIDFYHGRDDVISCPLAELTKQTMRVNDKAVALYLQQVQQSPVVNESLATTRAIIIVPLNLAFMIAVIVIYVLMPRKCSKTERDFWRLSTQELQQEFKKRGLSTNGSIRQDMIRHLCENDGICHSFEQRKLDKYYILNKLELQRALKNLGANISGKKQDLQYRLVLARETIYNALPDDELQRIARHCDSMENPESTCSNMELARRLAEAGPQIPLRAEG